MRVQSVVGVVVQGMGDEAMLLHPTGARALTLSATAAAVWACCDGSRQVDNIVQELAGDYGVAASTIRDDVLTAIQEFSDLGFVEIT